MFGPPVIPRSFRELDQLISPEKYDAGEAIPYILYDTQLYTSGTTTEQTFFTQATNDRTLSNLGGAPGQLPDPQYFEIHNLGFDILADATTAAGTEVGALDDVAKLMLVGRPFFQMFISDKLYGNGPLSFLHTSGGPLGNGWGTFTAEESIQVATNSYPDGGWNWQGGVIIPPKVNFSVVARWSAAQTLAIGNTQLRFWLLGILHRRVL